MTYTNEPVHEGFISNSSKKIGTLNNSIWQIPFKDSQELINKTNRYSTLGVQKLNSRGIKGGFSKALFHGLWSFFKHYFFKLGFLDGSAGFVIAFGNFEGTFYRYIKLMESQSTWSKPQVKAILKQKK